MEVWKDIKGYEGLYQVSDQGRVQSLDREILYSDGIVYNFKSKILRPGLMGSDVRQYLGVVLCISGKRTTKKIHQLVATAFLNHTPNGMSLVVDHIDFNKLNNKVENLRIVSNRENVSNHNRYVTSKYTGVHWDKERKKWFSQISLYGKRRSLGRFNSELEASEAYQKKLNEIIS